MKLYTSNYLIIQEFSKKLSADRLFSEHIQGQKIDKESFFTAMESSQYLIVNPDEIRKLYSAYVFQNKIRAQLTQPDPKM